MFMHPGAAGHPGARPFLLGSVLLMLFLTISTDWAPHRHSQEIRAIGRQQAAEAPAGGEVQQGIHEKIIYELSIGSERLERENAALRQHVLDLRRGFRAAGLDLNATATFLPIPGLEDMLANGSAIPADALHDGAGSKRGGEYRQHVQEEDAFALLDGELDRKTPAEGIRKDKINRKEEPGG